MGRGNFPDGQDGAGYRRVDGGRDVALGFGDQLALADLLANQYHRPGGAADVLVQGHEDPFRGWQMAQRHVGGGALVVVRVHAPSSVP